MELYVSVRSSDPNVQSGIAQMKIEGVTVRQPRTIKEILNPPIDYILSITVTFGVSVTAQIIARKLWEILKDKKETELTINNQPIEINAQKIEQLILISLKEKENE
jgi:hypothetical protein